MTFFLLFKDKIIKYLIVLIVSAMLLIAVYWRGVSNGKEVIELKYEAEKIVWQNTIATLQSSFEEQSKEIVENYTQQVEAYKRALATTKKENISKYVGNAKCEIPKGAIELHNKAAKNKQFDLEPPPDSKKISDKTLTDFVTITSQNYYICAENANKLKALQELVKKYQEAQKGLDNEKHSNSNSGSFFE